MNDIPIVHHNIERELSAWPIRSARRPMRPPHSIVNRGWVGDRWSCRREAAYGLWAVAICARHVSFSEIIDLRKLDQTKGKNIWRAHYAVGAIARFGTSE